MGGARPVRAGEIPLLFALLFGAGLQMLLPRGKRWIQSRLTLLVLLGFIHALVFWDGDILLAYGLVGLISWRMIRDAQSVKALFNTGLALFDWHCGLAVAGVISGSAPNRSWLPGPANIQYEVWWKTTGSMMEAIGNRADMLSSGLLALGAQYGWELAGLMLLGAALMRSGWLKGQFSLRHYRRTGLFLIALGVAINLPAIIANGSSAGLIAGAHLFCKRRVSWAHLSRCWDIPRLSMVSGHSCAARGWSMPWPALGEWR
jgi:uncharacterized protein